MFLVCRTNDAGQDGLQVLGSATSSVRVIGATERILLE